MDFVQMCREQQEWSHATFGDKPTVHSVIAHLEKEIGELKADPIHPIVLRALLVAALIDDGRCDVLHTTSGETFVQDSVADGPPYAFWPGPISAMPQEVYDELKARLK